MRNALIIITIVTVALLAFIFGVSAVGVPVEVKIAVGFVTGFALGSFGMRA
jgi:hypothetical protein